MDAIRLISFEDDSFHCESCNTELVAESDKIASQDIGDGDDNARRRRREKLRELLSKMEVRLLHIMLIHLKLDVAIYIFMFIHFHLCYFHSVIIINKKIQEELKPLTDQLSRVKDLEAPDYGTLQAWEVRASAVARASNNDPNGNDASRSGQGGTPMPFLGETKVTFFSFTYIQTRIFI